MKRNSVLIAATLYCHNHKKNFWHMAELFAPVFPLGYTFGRLGNFINGELYGRPTDASIGMYFPDSPGVLRHPSQLYEATFEGLVLFLIMWLLRKRATKPVGGMLAIYIFGYGFVRFFIEYFRQPDAHLGFIWLQFSMGQLLCMGMMTFAAALYAWLWQRHNRLSAVELMKNVPQVEEQKAQNWKKKKKKK